MNNKIHEKAHTIIQKRKYKKDTKRYTSRRDHLSWTLIQARISIKVILYEEEKMNLKYLQVIDERRGESKSQRP